MTLQLHPTLIPFVISVTGHRDPRPEDMARLREEVTNVLMGLRSRMRSTPLVVLGGLAEGADQLVAEVALEIGAGIATALPMPLEVYRTTMSPEAAARLDRLLALSLTVIDLPVGDRTIAELQSNEEARAMCYETLALFLARHGQALIALWDGVHSDKLGGTSRVVHYVRSGVVDSGEDPSAENPDARRGVVYQVVTPRLSATTEPQPVRTLTLGAETIDPSDPLAAQTENEFSDQIPFADVEKNFELFNSESIHIAARQTHPLQTLVAGDDSALSPFQRRLQTLFGIADRMSIAASRTRKRLLMELLLTAGAGTLFYSFQAELLHGLVWPWLIFPIFIIAGYLLHGYAKQTRVEGIYHDARALAEALRVQFFWDFAGIRRSVDQFYLTHRSSELDWIRFALKNIWLLHQGDEPAAGATHDYSIVLEQWVKDQQGWYDRQSRYQVHIVRQRARNSRWWVNGFSVFSFLVAAIVLVMRYFLGMSQQLDVEVAARLFACAHVFMVFLALFAGGFKIWIEQAGYEEQSRDYHFMQRVFQIRAKELQRNLHSKQIAEQVLLELGIEAMRENGRWLLLHRERPLEVLNPG